jgi:hypothetical protein
VLRELPAIICYGLEVIYLCLEALRVAARELLVFPRLRFGSACESILVVVFQWDGTGLNQILYLF